MNLYSKPDQKEHIEVQIEIYQKILDIFLSDDDLLNRIMEFGYDIERLNEGLLLCNETYQLVREARNEVTLSLVAYDKLAELKELAKSSFYENYRLARMIFVNQPTLASRLGLEDESTFPEAFFGKANRFYHVALTHKEILNLFKTYGVDQNRLVEGLELIHKIPGAKHTQRKTRYLASLAAHKRDEVILRFES